ncbi:MAG: choice-of-anchor B domain-containing protein [Alphaproteobacteria bacterium]|jgi:choice-of-anchor B domain-containing protein
MYKSFLMCVCILALVQGAHAPNVLAHSEADKARFVAQSGLDAGRCNNRFRPCKTIGYAVIQANKGDTILVAEGSYIVDSSQSIVYLVSNTHPVYGGYNVTDNYQNQSPSQFKSTLVGVPKQYTDILDARGFHVISDSKGGYVSTQTNMSDNATVNSGVNKQKIDQGLQSLALMQNSQPASACEDGSAAGFACSQISLLGRLPLNELPTNSGAANDIWGHVDLNDMREYAIIGLQRGLAVVDVSNPENPVVVGSVPGQITTWRDIKVLQYYDEPTKRFKAYAYSGADNVSQGLSVIDLSNLPNSIELTRRDATDRESHNIYISNVNYTTNSALNEQMPMLHVTGSSNFGGAWRTYSLETPASPQPAYANTEAQRSDYTHDASSMVVDDARASTDCGLAVGSSCNVIIDFNESEVRLWQHNSLTQATQLSEFTYPNIEYVHSGWWSEDKRFIFVHDELDERRLALNTTLNVFDVSDLRAPQLVATWRGPTRATDHNGFVKGNKYYMANYERGLTILDVSNPRAPLEVGFFDTFGASNNASFNGVWGVYPYLPSGIILASDIQGGLYVLKDESLLPQQDAAGFLVTQISAQEGEQVRVEVFKQGLGSMSVDYELLLPSASNNDIQASTGKLQWVANETQSQFIDIEVQTDTLDEFDELIVVVLNNPKEGDLVNGKSHAFVNIEGTAINTGSLSFEQANASALETQGKFALTVNRQNGSEGELSASIMLASGSAINTQDFAFANGETSLPLFWEAGDVSPRTIEIDIIDDASLESNEAFTALLSTANPLSAGNITQVNVVIKDDDSNTPPNVNAGADIQVNTRQTVTLSTASASDTQGELTFSWAQVSGSNITINNSSLINATFVAPASAASLTLQLTVSDEFGITSTDTLNIDVVEPLVNPPNQQSSSAGGTLEIYLLISLSLVLFIRRRLVCYEWVKPKESATTDKY